ncbi:TPA: hypothetical protein ACJIWU_004396 [Enterobacter chengduensis]|uniref:hypothetical protein n=1 Tax=Enterobacter chengduensis TaxID=2494701 RepID=UPI00103D30CF|nr:hypothetical protein [Enterobacter chengduensis]MBN9878528.1 hypothetical protein [Enterobacter chengduensis]MCK1097574.1 hypothetical protein [Enterobacter chengduensis]MCM7519932.1 hypothetical protein [Enterobacter chengduensis]HCD3312460.1 hypothetical protein [Enterobacter chengduensis]HDC4364713.1 hypothetical protein [Enterobacter chengduensis]
MAAKWQQTYSLYFHIPHYSTTQGVEIKVTYCFISLKFGTHNRLVAGSSPAGATRHRKGRRGVTHQPDFSGDMPGIFQKINYSDSWLIYDRSYHLTPNFLFSRVQKFDEAGRSAICIQQ